MFIIDKEYRVVSIVTTEYIIDILVFPSFVFHYLNYANMFYYHAKAVLPDNLGDLLWDLDLRRVLVIALIGIYLVGVLAGCFFIKVESNSSDIFSKTSSWVKYGVAIFVFFIVFVVLILLGPPVVSDNVDIVLSCFNSNKFDQFGFLFV